MATRVWIGPNEARDAEVISSTELVATYMGGGAGPEDVVVMTSLGRATSDGAFYAEQPPQPPRIDGVSPASGRGGTRVTITGSGFEA